ncbi:MAG: hypothetical protein GY930_15715 [bacterium]|nr:hypothetical protein [bacterium]
MYKYTLTFFVFFLLAVVSTAASQTLIATQETFEKECAGAIALGEAGDWKEAHDAWLDCVRSHAGKDYVRSRLPEIREALKRSAFWSGRKRPRAKDLIDGSLKTFNRSSGKLRIVYKEGEVGDFDRVANLLLHPLLFEKSYFVELEARPAVLAKQTIIVDFDGENGYLVGAGDWIEGRNEYYRHHLVRFSLAKQEVIEDADPKKRKAKAGSKAATLRVIVDRSSIKVRYNGRQVLSTRRKSGSLGKIALITPAHFTKLTIDGKASASWLDGLVDAAVQKDLTAFNAGYKEPVELSAWGAAVEAKKTTRDLDELTKSLRFPGEYTSHQSQCIDRVMVLVNQGQGSKARELLATFNPLECRPATAEMLKVLIALRESRLDLALKHIEAFCGETTPDLAVRTIEVLLLSRVERLADAQGKLELIVVDEPGDTALHAELAHVLMLRGDLDGARERINIGLGISPADADLLNLRTQLTKATQGPSWRRPQSVQGENFVVGSDLNKRSTRVVALVADRALQQYVDRFGPLSPLESKMPLYLFSGSSGYQAYIEGVAESSGESTLGIFSPLLKQVLVWNQSDRDGLVRVVRHEVMHAYMDRALGYSPTWFGEGLSEFCAEAVDESGEWQAGGRSEVHLRTLKRFGPNKIKLDQLLYLSHEDFMVNADYTYAMSWAFVDYLLTTTPKNRALFDSLWKTLSGTIGPNEASHQVFDAVDMKALNHSFWKHVKRQL